MNIFLLVYKNDIWQHIFYNSEIYYLNIIYRITRS